MLVTVIPTLAIAGYSLFSTTGHLKTSTLSAHENKIALTSERISNYLGTVSGDLFYLRDSSALHLYLSALQSDSSHSEHLLLTNLRNNFAKFSEQKKIYQQVRFIATNGDEVVRVDRKDNSSKVIIDVGLENIRDRDYFQNAVNLDNDELTVSPLGLTRNNGVIEKPIRPTIRYSTPVYDDSDELQGVIILNITADKIMEIIAAQDTDNEQLVFIDPDGFYYYHPDDGKRWGSKRDLDNAENIFNERPDLKAILGQKNQNQYFETDNDIITYSPIKLLDGKHHLGTVINIAPKAIVYAPVKKFLYVFLGIALLSLLLTFALSIFLSNNISRPLVTLTENVEALSKGELETPVIIDSKDEIGALSQAVERLRKSMVILMKRMG